jgi:hypothetical protein
MTMRQFLILLGSLAVLLAWTFMWGLTATGSFRQALRYLRTWLWYMRWLTLAGVMLGGLLVFVTSQP